MISSARREPCRERSEALLRFDYYLLNTYVPELDGSASELYARWIEQIVLADELGYYCAWLTEHHFRVFGGMLPSPQLLMGALSQRTSRIRFGTSVSLLPLHNPLRIAEEMAMVDVLSNGRLEFGVGRGMAQNLAAFGTDNATAQETLEEDIEIIRAAWSQPSFTWEGKHFQCPDPITIMPSPVQKPHPPFWVAVMRDPGHARAAGQQGFSILTLPWAFASFGPSRAMIEAYRDGVREGGHDPASCEVLAMYPTYVGATAELARAAAEPAYAHFRRVGDEERGGPPPDAQPYGAMVEAHRLIVGDAAMCREHVGRIRDELGVDRLGLLFHFGGLDHQLVLDSIHRFAAEVAPAFA